MAPTIIYTLASVILVSLVSFVGVFAFALKDQLLNKILMTLVSFSAGTLFGSAFLHLLPEAVEEQGLTVTVSLLALSGVLVFFLVERFVHYHHTCREPNHEGYPLVHKNHAHHLGIMNLAGDLVHNFGDGLIIAGSYLVSIPAGIAATVAVIFHEVPQEIADFGVLLYSGFTKKKALLLNFASATVAILGAVMGLAIGLKYEFFLRLLLPFAAGGFIYIAGSTLIPELHKQCGVKNSILNFLALVAGIALTAGLLFLES